MRKVILREDDAQVCVEDVSDNSTVLAVGLKGESYFLAEDGVLYGWASAGDTDSSLDWTWGERGDAMKWAIEKRWTVYDLDNINEIGHLVPGR